MAWTEYLVRPYDVCMYVRTRATAKSNSPIYQISHVDLMV